MPLPPAPSSQPAPLPTKSTVTATAKFHPFPRLPYELRRIIYLLATPQRVVHVKERFTADATYAATRQHVLDHAPRTEWPQVVQRYRQRQQRQEEEQQEQEPLLHPSLAYFSHIWQTPGSAAWFPPEEHGGDEVPALAQLLLPDHPNRDQDAAWHLWRQTRLHSTTPVPALLHTCAESRLVLRESGYELAFGTRATCSRAYTERLWDRMMLPGMTVGGGRDDENGDDHDAGDDADMNKSNGNNSNNADIDERLLRQSEHGGMTWFNFARDVLYIGHNGSDFAPEQRDYPRLLLHSQPWDVSVFLPHDLARVTRLALPGASSMAGSTWFAHVPHAYMGLVDHLRLFPRLKELLLAEWALLGGHLDDDGDDVHVVVDAETGAGLPDGPSPQQVHRDRIARASETWFYLPMRDIDAFSPRVYKMEDGQQATAVAAMALQMHSVLKSQHPWVPRRGGAGSSAAGRLPDEEEEEEAEEEEAHSFLAQQTRLWTADLATLAGQPPLGGGLGGLPRLPAMKTMLRITLAHVGTEDMLEALQAERQAVWAGIVASDDGDAVSGAQVRRDSVDIFSARPIMPPPFDRQIGWTSEKVCPPRREQVVWSVVDKGMMRDAVDIGNLEFSLDPQV